MARQEALIWAAGFFDGEGCISVTRQLKRGKVYHCLMISVYQNHSASLNELRELFGGSITSEDDAWKWRACGPTASAALQLMLPHLRVKRDQAAIAIVFQARRLPPRGPKRPADFNGDQDEADYLELKRLKKVVV